MNKVATRVEEGLSVFISIKDCLQSTILTYVKGLNKIIYYTLWHFLYFLLLPHGQSSFLPTLISVTGNIVPSK